MVKTRETLQRHRDVNAHHVSGDSEPIKCGPNISRVGTQVN